MENEVFNRFTAFYHLKRFPSAASLGMSENSGTIVVWAVLKGG
jgi:hypothetical protein